MYSALLGQQRNVIMRRSTRLSGNVNDVSQKNTSVDGKNASTDTKQKSTKRRSNDPQINAKTEASKKRKKLSKTDQAAVHSSEVCTKDRTGMKEHAAAALNSKEPKIEITRLVPQEEVGSTGSTSKRLVRNKNTKTQTRKGKQTVKRSKTSPITNNVKDAKSDDDSDLESVSTSTTGNECAVAGKKGKQSERTSAANNAMPAKSEIADDDSDLESVSSGSGNESETEQNDEEMPDNIQNILLKFESGVKERRRTSKLVNKKGKKSKKSQAADAAATDDSEDEEWEEVEGESYSSSLNTGSLESWAILGIHPSHMRMFKVHIHLLLFV